MKIPLLDPDLLKAFIAVADHRSFTRAATVLNRTQSAVSMQIKRLEERVDTVLFHRTKSQVDLSPAGEGLLGYARRILSLSEEAVGKIQERRVEGSVRLGIMEDYASRIVPPLLSSFAISYPHINVEVEVGLTSLLKERLGETLDLVIAMHPEGNGDGEFLRREQAIWAAGPSPLLSDAGPVPIALYPQGCLFRKWAIEALDEARRPWRMTFVSQNHAVVASVVSQGPAVTVVKAGTIPASLRPLSERDGLPRLPKADIHLHRATLLSRPAALLADHLALSLKRPLN